MDFGNLFLVEYTLTTTHYMADPEREELRRLVMAEDDDMAMLKLIDHHESKSRNADVTYYVNVNSVTGVLL